MENGDKTFYDKKIVYLDYLERGEKIKNGGFAKWEARGGDCRIQIQIRGLYATDTLQGEIQLISGPETYPADRIGLQFGTGEYASRWKCDNLAGSGVSYGECDGILIRLSDTRMLKAQWRRRTEVPGKAAETGKEAEPAQERIEVRTPETSVKTAQGQGLEESAKVTLEQGWEEPGKTPQGQKQEEPVPEALLEPVWEPEEEESKPVSEPEKTEPEETGSAESTLEEEAEESGGEVKTEEFPPEELPPEEVPTKEVRTAEFSSKEFPLSRDKWEQLRRIYPKIHPFGDDREYLSVTPRDFIVMARQYQELVQNSFLLHGYYNYGHLILTKILDKNEERYYLGVPGAYYDKEKQAALMFGFEGFEAGTEKMEEGGFGYYMKRVEI